MDLKYTNMDERALEALNRFRGEANRAIEESFAQMLCEKPSLRFFFNNENFAATNGTSISVDPAFRETFCDTKALTDAENFLEIGNEISSNMDAALKMSTRAINIHECLHVQFSNLPSGVESDKRGSTKMRKYVLHNIYNCVEDAFIEAAGCSAYDNLEHYILWQRITSLFSNSNDEGTAEQNFKKGNLVEKDFDPHTPVILKNPDKPTQKELREIKLKTLFRYMSYMFQMIMYPFMEIGPPEEEFAEYVEKTKDLYNQAVAAGNADERYAYIQKIFDIIEPLIPKGRAPKGVFENFEKRHGFSGTHSSRPSMPQGGGSKGKDVVITRRLFCDKDGNPLSPEAIDAMKDHLRREIKLVLSGAKNEETESDEDSEGYIIYVSGSSYDAAVMHDEIKIEVRHPVINRELKTAYNNLCKKYKLSINANKTRFSQLLRGRSIEREGRRRFGAGVDSRNFADIKKRFWYRYQEGVDVPSINFLFLIDGSGSMEGERREAAIAAMVNVHEVLQSNGINHSIVEHRAIYDEPKLVHNILVNFNGKADEKYNILTLASDEGTREGLTLYWAEKYLAKQGGDDRIIIMISDGVPEHSYGNRYYMPPASVKDTNAAARKILRRGTKIMAIALDEQGSTGCYNALKEIYPVVLACNNLNRLTEDLLRLISKSYR